MTDTLASPTLDEPDVDDWLECITQSPDEPSEPEYLEVCTIKADLIAESINCVRAGCGGHPVCRPCYELGVAQGKIVT